MGSFFAQFFDPGVASRYLPAMLAALGVTVGLALVVILTGLAAGLALCLVRTLRIRPLALIVVAYADLFRCLPPLTLMFVFYFAFPLAGLSMTGPIAAWLALSLVLAAFSEEVFWTAILSVGKGQWEAARSTGLSFGGTLRNVVLPQAMRIALPPLTNRTIAITKGVALASAVAVPEMLGEATAATSYAANSTPLMMAAAGYLAIFLPLAIFSRRLEARMRWGAVALGDVLASFFDLDVLTRYWPYLLAGLGQTLLLSAIAIPLGLVAGLGLALLGSDLGHGGRRVVASYVDLLRAFPPLVLLILVNAGLPHFGVRLSPLASVTIALLLNSSAYYAEIFRAGLLSVPHGLTEAARATGLSYARTAYHVRVPLAARNVLPDLLSNTLELVKLTSIAAVVTYIELTQAARVVQGLTFSPSPIIAAAILYFIILWPLARVVSRLEQRTL